MTTIAAALHSGLVTMVADSQLTGDGYRYTNAQTKLVTLPDSLIGLAGPLSVTQRVATRLQRYAAALAGGASQIQTALDSLHNDLKQENHLLPEYNAAHMEETHFQCLVANSTGLYAMTEDRSVVGPLSSWAIGSGWRFAMGALLAGATPQRAVLVAAQLDLNTNTDLQTGDIPLA